MKKREPHTTPFVPLWVDSDEFIVTSESGDKSGYMRAIGRRRLGRRVLRQTCSGSAVGSRWEYRTYAVLDHLKAGLGNGFS